MTPAKSKVRLRAAVVAATALGALIVPAAANAAVSSAVAGGALTVASTAGDAITITCDLNQVKVNGADPGTGAAACNAITSIDVDGGPDANAITLTGVTATAFPLVTSVSIDGAGGNDTIAGSEHVDTMLGGEGNDRIAGDDNPPSTRDDFQGQGGDDTLVWNPGDDDDRMEGGDGTDTIEVNGGNGPEQFTVKPSPTAGRVAFDRTGPTPPGPFNLDIGTSERLDLNAAGGDDTLATDRGLEALGLSVDVDGGDGNDTLEGGDGPDTIAGGTGDDAIRSRDQAADQVDCGEGLDIAKVDKRDALTGCDIAIGGLLRVRLLSREADVAAGVALLRMRCVATERCRATVQLRRGDRPLGKGRFRSRRTFARTVRVTLNRRARRLLANDADGSVRVRVRIDARDSKGNGWRTTARVRLVR